MGPINPADHFTLVMHREIRAAGLAGNLCAIALELDGVPPRATVAARCRQFNERFPQATARLRQHGRRFHWEPRAGGEIPFHPIAWNVDEPGARDAILAEVLNRQHPEHDIPPIELFLLEGDGRSVLVLRWFHPAFDAKGAELVLYHLFGDAPPADATAEPVLENLIARWSLWDKIKLGFKAKRMVEGLDRHVSTLPSAATHDTAGFRFNLLTLDRDDSSKVLANARRDVGLMGTTLYFIGCMMRALTTLGCAVEGDAFCVPYAMNLRRRRAVLPVFGNQVSFLFAQAPTDLLADRAALFRHLLDQSKHAVRDGLDRAMLPLLQAGSWLPLEKLGRIVRYNAQGRERSSFWFSFTGEMEPPLSAVEGCTVTGIGQFTPVTAPPSLGLLVSQTSGRLTLCFNFIPEHFDADWLDRLRAALLTELLDAGVPA